MKLKTLWQVFASFSFAPIKNIPVSEESELLIITWNDGEREYKNHAFTGKESWDVIQNWVRIIAKEFDLENKILELN